MLLKLIKSKCYKRYFPSNLLYFFLLHVWEFVFFVEVKHEYMSRCVFCASSTKARSLCSWEALSYLSTSWAPRQGTDSPCTASSLYWNTGNPSCTNTLHLWSVYNSEHTLMVKRKRNHSLVCHSLFLALSSNVSSYQCFSILPCWQTRHWLQSLNMLGLSAYFPSAHLLHLVFTESVQMSTKCVPIKHNKCKIATPTDILCFALPGIAFRPETH